MTSLMRRRLAGFFAAALLLALVPGGAAAHDPTGGGAPQSTQRTQGTQDDDATDPARNTPLPCEDFPRMGLPARSARNMIHLANVCGIVGTDVEFQSRTDASGKIRDYAFVGTMGAGFRIFDVTDPSQPIRAGGYVDSGWQNDIQVRGNVAVSTFDGVAGEDSTASTCLKERHPEAMGQGVDIFRLVFDRQKAASPGPLSRPFTVELLTCVANPPGGAHNSTLHPSGEWLAISNPSSDWAVDVIKLDLSGPAPKAVHKYRLIDESRRDLAGRCPSGATFTCIVMERPAAPALGSDPTFPPCSPAPCASSTSAAGLWRPHDVSFSADGDTMYVAALNSTFIVGVRNVLSGSVRTKTIIPNLYEQPREVANRYNIQLSHTADVNPGGKLLVINDERGGGLSETSCNTSESGVIGALHIWALRPVDGIARSSGATVSNPKKLGVWFNPNPTLLSDELEDEIQELLPVGRLERGCTVHQSRIGGNGSAGPGPSHPSFDGVSRMGPFRLSYGGYGMGVWVMDFGLRSRDDDGIAEDPNSTWGNTLAWNIQPGSDAWSGKEYKGHIYAGDLIRGFDVYRPSVAADPVVAIHKGGPSTAAPGTTLRYRISYQNLGPAASRRASITDALPKGLRFVSASDGGTYDGTARRVTWSLGSVPAGTSDVVTLKVRVRGSVEDGTVITNRARFQGDLTVSPPAGVHFLVVRSSAARGTAVGILL